MKTDWNSIRDMLNAAVDACERIETLRYGETDREATTDIGGQKVSVHDFLVSAWIYPEKLRYQIIRERHDTGVDLPYVPETSRILLAMSQAAIELVDAGEVTPAKPDIQKMIDWFEEDLVRGIERAITTHR
ncbi:hypothetical protein FY137_00655 [Agrobacterium tumefaciens]|nr:hypothetical protein FY137_00655 [Agrobacterium tumefaciens]